MSRPRSRAGLVLIAFRLALTGLVLATGPQVGEEMVEPGLNGGLVVLDPLAAFLPGCENHAGSVLEALTPLQRLTARDVSVLLWHHPGRKDPLVGEAARGSGALLAYADISYFLLPSKFTVATSKRPTGSISSLLRLLRYWPRPDRREPVTRVRVGCASSTPCVGHPMRSSTVRAAMLSALFAGLAAGCSSEPTRYPVSGTVTMDGVPAGLAVVKFFPADPGTNATSGGSVIADIAGKFSIGAGGTNTGLPAGEYKVTFSQTVDRGRPVMGSGGKKSEAVPGVEAVPEAYRNPKTTPISAHVGRDFTTFTFDIKKKT